MKLMRDVLGRWSHWIFVSLSLRFYARGHLVALLMIGFTFKWNPLEWPPPIALRLTFMTILMQLAYLYLPFYYLGLTHSVKTWGSIAPTYVGGLD